MSETADGVFDVFVLPDRVVLLVCGYVCIQGLDTPKPPANGCAVTATEGWLIVAWLCVRCACMCAQGLGTPKPPANGCAVTSI